MKLNRAWIALLICILLTGCGGGGDDGVGGDTGAAPEANVVAITVNGSLCSDTLSFRYPNKPCVSVTVCTPGTSSCQTINDILLDTGSFGLRIFQQELSVPLTPVTNGSGAPIAECIQFLDESSLWGPVRTASVVLGQEPAVQVPIQVIDSAFAPLRTACQGAEQNPSSAGFKGILGVGVFDHDCGHGCADPAGQNIGIYFACNGAGCSGASVPLSSQVRNPVALLPLDNNGVVVKLPNIPSEGVPAINGSLILGIGTRSNNTASGVTAFPADNFGDFITTFGGASYSSFIDTGSNGIFFTPPPSIVLPTCPSPNSDWFCPPSTTTFTATTTGASGSPSSEVTFQIGRFTTLINSSNNVFNDIGGPLPGNQFDWGLPFFFGRNVFVGLQGQASSLGTGPYWAY